MGTWHGINIQALLAVDQIRGWTLKKYYFDYLKHKNASKRITVLQNPKSIIVNDLAKIWQMFDTLSKYFRWVPIVEYSYCFPPSLLNGCIVLPSGVWSTDLDMIGEKNIDEELLEALNMVKNGNLQVWMTFLVSTSRRCQSLLDKIWNVWLRKCFT